jgi:hypothetical protein
MLGELCSVKNLIENGSSIWMLLLKLIFKLTVVWPNVHRTEGMKIVNKLDGVLIFIEHGPHHFSFGLRKGMRAWISITARSIFIAPKITIVSVNVYSL